MNFELISNLLYINYISGKRKSSRCKNANSARSSSISGSSTISSEYIYQLMENLKGKTNRQTTRSSYHKTWTRFNTFLIKLDRRPETWEDRLMLYVTYLIDQGLKSTTIKSYVSVIKYVLKMDGYSWNEDRVLLNSLTKACKLKNDVVTTRLPISLRLLEMILFEVPRVQTLQDQPYLVCLYQALFALAYRGLFRIGELTTGDHPMKAKDIHLGRNKNKILVVLYTSKTHSLDQKPQKIKITANPQYHNKLNFCPFRLVENYINIRNEALSDTEPFFVFRDYTPVAPANARVILKQTLLNLNLDSELYNCHSFRIGKASDMQKIGYSILEIQQKGRWVSNAVFKYLRS